MFKILGNYISNFGILILNYRGFFLKAVVFSYFRFWNFIFMCINALPACITCMPDAPRGQKKALDEGIGSPWNWSLRPL